MGHTLVPKPVRVKERRYMMNFDSAVVAVRLITNFDFWKVGVIGVCTNRLNFDFKGVGVYTSTSRELEYKTKTSTSQELE
ncbi:hypothetical protein Taro_034764 [Colocasia esculenta]|uniref:Uncharacterized protein n=1 Tax=Colocasia esculenta TaxID=4460 RepID=A0A843W8J2_COLES|nr:hypothetical protein [Colocasia esculenta]